MMGPGKHDDLCTYVREQLDIGETGGVLLIVLHPDKNLSGFAVQADYPTMVAMPEILERVARQIREDRERAGVA